MDDEDPYITRIRKSGCFKEHEKLQDCHYDTKDFRKCKLEMKRFKECFEKHNQQQSVNKSNY
ncbi:hypothetical protein BC833DRAFT_586535 [Globomyces pollinis-pini]|nr:hypothetical protein BC833DRAFT_586535 [Globomyces pollinis-pini]